MEALVTAAGQQRGSGSHLGSPACQLPSERDTLRVQKWHPTPREHKMTGNVLHKILHTDVCIPQALVVVSKLSSSQDILQMDDGQTVRQTNRRIEFNAKNG